MQSKCLLEKFQQFNFKRSVWLSFLLVLVGYHIDILITQNQKKQYCFILILSAAKAQKSRRQNLHI